MEMHSTASPQLHSSNPLGRPSPELHAARLVRPKRRVATCSYQNGVDTYRNSPTFSSRAALAETLDTPIDISREAVTAQTVRPITPRRDFRVSLFDAMKFYGPAPERINGRLAMLGFLLGAINEFKTATPILQQAKAAPILVAATVTLFTVASLVPIQKGARPEAFGAFSPKAEIANGRAAMLGLAVLLYLEHKAGVSFF